jgi:predicted membrane protein
MLTGGIMGFLATKLFWGGLLICWGIALIVEKVLQINIPFMRFVFAFILIYGGIYLITKNSNTRRVNVKTNVFNKILYHSAEGKEYNVVFGSSMIDLSDISDFSEEYKVNTVFGSSEIYLSEDLNYDIKINTVFGETSLPNNKDINFGSNNYSFGSEAAEKISLELNTVFGESIVKVKEGNKEKPSDE